jgi:hypothetical protein
MEEELEQERLRLQPFLEFYRFATGSLNANSELQNYASGVHFQEFENEWYEDAFHDEEYNLEDSNSDWNDVDTLNLEFRRQNRHLPESLFVGSNHKSCDFARFLLSFKSHNLKIGDTIMAEIVGMFASFLPKGILHIYSLITI